ncbi:MAG: MerR family transcriptional regulator [Burkholderiaceae bacterium]|nr:MerR family transcriptional regulator [Burkholderiaceae bacterium]
MENILPPIPAKRYFTIGEVGELCGVKPHVLRYWEQEFTQLRPMKRSGNRRYYQHNEVLMIRRIRDLLYDQGFTISGARNKLQELGHPYRVQKRHGELSPNGQTSAHLDAQSNGYEPDIDVAALETESTITKPLPVESSAVYKWHSVRQELFAIRDLLGAAA